MATAKTASKKTTTKKKGTRKPSVNKGGSVPVKQEPSSMRSLSDFNFHDMEKLFQDFLTRSPFGISNWPSMPDFDELRAKMKNRLPDIDVVDRKKEVVIKAELPGCDKDDVDVSIDESCVKITTQHREEKQTKDDNFIRKEISSRQYNRTLPLPAGVDASKVHAGMKRGVLRIRLPKTDRNKTKRVSIS